LIEKSNSGFNHPGSYGIAFGGLRKYQSQQYQYGSANGDADEHGDAYRDCNDTADIDDGADEYGFPDDDGISDDDNNDNDLTIARNYQ
jgi:hypothetical protein